MYETQEQTEAPEVSLRESPPSPVAKIETINITLRALWNQKTSATYKDLAGPAGLHPTVASQALSASRDLGLTRLAGKKGLYEFTPEGKEYCRSLTGNREAESQEQLRNIILNNPQWAGVVGFLKTNEGIPREPMDIVIDVERKLGKQWSPIMRRNVALAIASILEYAGLVKIESGKIVSLARQDMEPGPVVVARASVRDISLQPSTWPTASDFRRAADRMESPRPDFAEFRDESISIRVRKDAQSIAAARGFLDFVEASLRLAQQVKKTTEPTTGEEAPGKS